MGLRESDSHSSDRTLEKVGWLMVSASDSLRAVFLVRGERVWCVWWSRAGHLPVATRKDGRGWGNKKEKEM